MAEQLEGRREFIGLTRNRRIVSAEMLNSHFATHLAEQPGLRVLAQEALRQVIVTERDTAIQVDMGREIGYIDLVELKPGEKVRYGKRRNRTSWIPFVDRDGERPRTNFLVVILRELEVVRLANESTAPELLGEDGSPARHHDLFSAYIGIKTPGLQVVIQTMLPEKACLSGEVMRLFWVRKKLMNFTQVYLQSLRARRDPRY